MVTESSEASAIWLLMGDVVNDMATALNFQWIALMVVCTILGGFGGLDGLVTLTTTMEELVSQLSYNLSPAIGDPQPQPSTLSTKLLWPPNRIQLTHNTQHIAQKKPRQKKKKNWAWTQLLAKGKTMLNWRNARKNKTKSKVHGRKANPIKLLLLLFRLVERRL